MIYKFRINDLLKLLKNLSTKNYNRFRLIKRKFVEKAIAFVNVIRKLRYDATHINLKLIIDNYAYLYLYNGYTISNFINKKLNQQRVSFFKILKKIDTLIYRFELFSIIKIHSVIFIIQLKSTSAFDVNFYCRSRFKHSSPMQLKNNNNSKNSIKFYKIERLLNRRIIAIDRINYLIK